MAEQPEVLSPTKSGPKQRFGHPYSEYDMEDFSSRHVTVFPRFLYTELPNFQREASQAIQLLHRGFEAGPGCSPRGRLMAFPSRLHSSPDDTSSGGIRW